MAACRDGRLDAITNFTQPTARLFHLLDGREIRALPRLLDLAL